MQAIAHLPAPTCCRHPASPGRRPATRLHALPQRHRVSAIAIEAVDEAVGEEAAATASVAEAPADAPPLAIPVIPAAGWLAPATNGAPPPRALADDIMAAATEYGMFQIVDHGLSLTLLANLREAQRAFFALPLVSWGGGGVWGIALHCGIGCSPGTCLTVATEWFPFTPHVRWQIAADRPAVRHQSSAHAPLPSKTPTPCLPLRPRRCRCTALC